MRDYLLHTFHDDEIVAHEHASPEVVAADVVAAARSEAAQIRAAAYDEGLALGRDAAAHATDALRAAATQVLATGDALISQLEPLAVSLAMRIAEQIVCAELRARPEIVARAVEGTLRALIARENVVVLVHPEDLDVVRVAVDELGATLGAPGQITVVGERRVSRGGALVQTEAGDIDVTVEARLANAAELIGAHVQGADAD